MGSQNSTGSGSCASGAGNGGKASMFVRFATFIERILHRPLMKSSKKKIAMSATRRESFVWKITRAPADKSAELAKCFVRVMEEPKVEVARENAPHAMIEIPKVEVTSEEACHITLEEPKVETESEMLPQISAVQTIIDEAAEKPQVITKRKEDHSLLPETTKISDSRIDTSAIAADNVVPAFAGPGLPVFNDSVTDLDAEVLIDQELVKPAVSDVVDVEPIRTVVPDYVIDAEEFTGAEAYNEPVESEEEKAFYSGLYEDLSAQATIELMETLVPEVFYHPPEYVISDISCSESAETVIDIPAVPEAVKEEPKVSHVTDFIFGFQTPKAVNRGSVSFSFCAGSDDDDQDTECDNIRVVSHEMDSNAVSVSPYNVM